MVNNNSRPRANTDVYGVQQFREIKKNPRHFKLTEATELNNIPDFQPNTEEPLYEKISVVESKEINNKTENMKEIGYNLVYDIWTNTELNIKEKIEKIKKTKIIHKNYKYTLPGIESYISEKKINEIEILLSKNSDDENKYIDLKLFENNNNAIAAGFITKQSGKKNLGLIHNWRRRLLVLYGNKLEYFECSKNKCNLKGTIKLEEISSIDKCEITTCPTSEIRENTMFKIITNKKQNFRKYYFECDDKEGQLYNSMYYINNNYRKRFYNNNKNTDTKTISQRDMWINIIKEIKSQNSGHIVPTYNIMPWQRQNAGAKKYRRKASNKQHQRPRKRVKSKKRRPNKTKTKKRRRQISNKSKKGCGC
jgi:hypothetical protein